jgi:hypothetical protein
VAAFAWLRALGLGVGAALAGGLVFEIAPYRLEQSTGHLLGPVSLLLPLSLWAFERARRGSRWWLVLSAAALASIPASGQVHLALGAVPFFVAYALVRTRDRWTIAGALGAAALAVAAGIGVWQLVIEGSIGEGGRSLRQVAFYSADLVDFVSRDARHGSERFVFLGWATLAAAAGGLALLIRRRVYGLAAVLGCGALVPIVLALGTNTPLYEAVRFVFPPLRYPRVPERLVPVACLALAALVAFAVDWLLRAEIRPVAAKLQAVTWRRRLLAGMAALMLVALFTDLRVTTFEATAADEDNGAYAALSRRGRLLEVPVFSPGIHYGSVYLYYSTQTPRERPQGYSTLAPRIGDVTVKALRPINCGDWTERPGRLIRALGVRSLTFHNGLFRRNAEVPNTGWFAWRALVRHGYRPQARDGAVTLLERRGGGPPPRPPVPEPPREGAILCQGWAKNDGGGRRMEMPHAALWAYNAGGSDLRLFMRSARRQHMVVRVDGDRRYGRAVGALRQVRIPLGPEGWHLVTMDARIDEVDGRPEGPRILAYAVG